MITVDELKNKFEFRSYGHALEILEGSFEKQWGEIKECLNKFQISYDDILEQGGNESPIPKKIDDFLYPLDWREIRITGELTVKLFERQGSKRGHGDFSGEPFDIKVLSNFIDGHNIDFVKDAVAFDLEWNSKDQTFDRDLLAMRTYFDCGIIDVGIILTRSAELNDIFKAIPYKGKTLIQKYGASTTWMKKLTDRLDSRRNGGCPILAIGIKKNCFVEEKN